MGWNIVDGNCVEGLDGMKFHGWDKVWDEA